MQEMNYFEILFSITRLIKFLNQHDPIDRQARSIITLNLTFICQSYSPTLIFFRLENKAYS